MGAPIFQAAAHTNHTISVYPDRVEIRSGWQGQNVEEINLRDIESVTVRGVVNCALTITSNTGRIFELRRMSLPEARRVRSTIETRKQRAGIYD
ncbi:MAG: PH domain-containing protein [Rubrobacteraceae bacterium]